MYKGVSPMGKLDIVLDSGSVRSTTITTSLIGPFFPLSHRLCG